VANKPVLIYDGHCAFCRIWLDYWRQLTGDRIEYLASQEVGDRFPQIASNAYKQSVQLVRPDGTVASGARAVFETLNKQGLYSWIAAPSELAYRFIAPRRNAFYQLTRFTFGIRIKPTRFAATQWLFLRALALIYAIAFGSLALQVAGLLGARGVVPVVPFLASVERTGSALRFLAVPSLFWIAADDTTLVVLCFAGMLFSAMLFLTGFSGGRFENFIPLLLFILYLSYASVGQEFLSFQWDSLLLEAGFLTIFLGQSHRALAIPLAGIPPILSLGSRQTPQRGPHLAQSLGPRLPLAHAAAADCPRVVCRQTSCWLPAFRHRRDARHRGWHAAPHLLPAPLTHLRRVVADWSANPDHGHRQLYVLQPAHARAYAVPV